MPDTQPLVDQQGKAHDVPVGDVAGALDRGWRAPTAEDASRITTESAHEQDYGGSGGAIKAGLYGLARGGTLGGSDLLFRAGGASPERLRGFAEQFPKLTLGAETLGALVPALAGPESLLARNPAGGVAAIGRTIVDSAEGAGALGKIATAAAGGGAEGALFSGGQYLSQVALEDKPLAAEGFLGAMGKGALWAAPIGGTLAIGEGVLHRAKALFPRSQVTKEAARAVDQEATSAISQIAGDGDRMVQAARQKIALTQAKAGSAATTESASRAMFGVADPAAMSNQVGHSLEHSQLTEAVDKYTRAKSKFDDWVRVEADPDLEAALLRLRAPDVQVGAPRLRAAEFGEVVPPQRAEFGAVGTPGPHEPPRVPITTELPPLPITSHDLTRTMKPGEMGIEFDPITKNSFRGEVPAVLPRTPEPFLAEGTPSQVKPDDEILGMLRRLRGEVSPAQEGSIPEYGALKRHLDSIGTDYFEQTIPARSIEERGWYEPPGGGRDKVRSAKARDAVRSETPPVVSLTVTPTGKVVVHDGHYLLDAAAEAGRPVRVKWTTGYEPAADEVLRGGTRAVEGADSDLSSLLQATKGKLESGESISKIGAESSGRADYVAGKAAKTEQAAEEARAAARARKGTYSDSDMARQESALRGEAEIAHDESVGPIERDAIESLKKKIAAGEVTGEVGPFRPQGLQAAAERELARRQDVRTIVDRSLGKEMRGLAKDDAVGAALRRRNGKDVDIGPNLARGARAINELESASADLVDVLGPEAPKAAVEHASAYRAAVKAKAEQSGASAAKSASDIATKVSPADQLTLIEPTQLPKGPFEAEEFVRLQEAIHGGKVKGEIGPFNSQGESIAAEREMARRAGEKTIVDKGIKPAMAGAREEAKQAAFEAKTEKGIDTALRKAHAADAKHGGSGGQSVARAIAGAIDDIAAKIPTIAEASSHGEAGGGVSEHKKNERSDKTVVDSDIAKLLRREDSKSTPLRAQSASKPPATATQSVLAPGGSGLLSTAADIGTALEVLHAMGVHVPDIDSIPVVGPVLSLFLKARAVLGILGRKGGSISRTTESVVAAKSAMVRDRVSAATVKLLDVGAKGARSAAPVAGPAGALAYKLFPGNGDTASKDPRVLYEARMGELSRALQPGAIEHAVADRFRTSDPDLQDAVTAQARRAVEFVASKAPRQTMPDSMLPGDGKWHPSRAALETWSRYVAAVHDPAGVLEDLAKGHVTVESAETLRKVYPKLYAEAQRLLLEHAAEFQRTLPYTRRVSIAIMYQVPVDGSLAPGHMQYLQGPPAAMPTGPTQAPAPPGAPALTAPLQLGNQTMTSLDRRAGA